MARRFLIWFWSGNRGGSQFAVNLAQRLALRFGADAVTLSLRADDPSLQRAAALGLHVLGADIVSDRRRPLASLGGLSRGRKILREHAANADVVIVPMNFALAAPLAGAVSAPLVYCAHDPDPHPGDYAALAQRATQAALMRSAARVVASSDYAAQRLRAQGVKEVVTAPLSSVFEPREKREVAPGRVLLAGRMIAYKGLDLLAEALPLLKHDMRLTIAGDGPALSVSARAALADPRVNIEKRQLTDDELDTLIAEASVVLAPYRSATQSGIVAQALAHSRPCVVTPVGALPEQIGQGQAGWIAESASPRALADAISAALDASAHAAKAAGARALARAAWEHDYWGWLADL